VAEACGDPVLFDVEEPDTCGENDDDVKLGLAAEVRCPWVIVRILLLESAVGETCGLLTELGVETFVVDVGVEAEAAASWEVLRPFGFAKCGDATSFFVDSDRRKDL